MEETAKELVRKKEELEDEREKVMEAMHRVQNKSPHQNRS